MSRIRIKKRKKITANFSAKTHEQLIAKWRENLEYVKAYDGLEGEFVALKDAIRARKMQNVRQTDVAESE